MKCHCRETLWLASDASSVDHFRRRIGGTYLSHDTLDYFLSPSYTSGFRSPYPGFQCWDVTCFLHLCGRSCTFLTSRSLIAWDEVNIATAPSSTILPRRRSYKGHETLMPNQSYVTSVLVFSASGSSLSCSGLQPSTFERNASTCNEIHLTALHTLLAEPKLALRNIGPWGLCPKIVKKEECLVTSVFFAEVKITKWLPSEIRPVWTRLSVVGVINERQTYSYEISYGDMIKNALIFHETFLVGTWRKVWFGVYVQNIHQGRYSLKYCVNISV